MWVAVLHRDRDVSALPAWVRLDRLDPMGRVFRQGKQLAEGEKGQK